MIGLYRERPPRRRRSPARSLPAALRDGPRLRRFFEAVEAGASTYEANAAAGADVVSAVSECRRVLDSPEATARVSAPEVQVMRAVVERYAEAVGSGRFMSAPADAETCAEVLAEIAPAPGPDRA